MAQQTKKEGNFFTRAWNSLTRFNNKSKEEEMNKQTTIPTNNEIKFIETFDFETEMQKVQVENLGKLKSHHVFKLERNKHATQSIGLENLKKLSPDQIFELEKEKNLIELAKSKQSEIDRVVNETIEKNRLELAKLKIKGYENLTSEDFLKLEAMEALERYARMTPEQRAAHDQKEQSQQDWQKTLIGIETADNVEIRRIEEEVRLENQNLETQRIAAENTKTRWTYALSTLAVVALALTIFGVTRENNSHREYMAGYEERMNREDNLTERHAASMEQGARMAEADAMAKAACCGATAKAACCRPRVQPQPQPEPVRDTIIKVIEAPQPAQTVDYMHWININIEHLPQQQRDYHIRHIQTFEPVFIYRNMWPLHVTQFMPKWHMRHVEHHHHHHHYEKSRPPQRPEPPRRPETPREPEPPRQPDDGLTGTRPPGVGSGETGTRPPGGDGGMTGTDRRRQNSFAGDVAPQTRTRAPAGTNFDAGRSGTAQRTSTGPAPQRLESSRPAMTTRQAAPAQTTRSSTAAPASRGGGGSGSPSRPSRIVDDIWQDKIDDLGR